MMRRVLWAVVLLLAGCATDQTVASMPGAHSRPMSAGLPPFATRPYAPFSRPETVAIAMREWHLFGDRVDDDPPGTRPEPPADEKPERFPGLWQRVGEYWWLGQDPGREESAWTGKHNDTGRIFASRSDANYAWSAAFISYIMRMGGAGTRFPSSPSHFTYINAAAQATGEDRSLVVHAEPPNRYAPRLGDLICTGRDGSTEMRFAALPAGRFASHCDIVVKVAPGMLSVVGGNVDDAVTMKHVPTTAQGMLATPDGHVVDDRYPWFVVLRVLYDTDSPVRN